jgi:uroporphyrinogen decarboxylase
MRNPDFSQMLRVLERKAPERPTLFEFFLNEKLYAKLAGRPMPGRGTDAHMRWLAEAFRAAGYDYVTAGDFIDFRFPLTERHTEKTASLNEKSVIRDRASFAAYPWPDPDAADYSVLDRLETLMPAGMKAMINGPCGVLENAVALAGFDNLCVLCYDDPALAGDLFDAVGSRLLRFYENALRHGAAGMIISNDDWGFKTQTMLSPAMLRKYVFPWHARIVRAAHEAGRPALLHSCGYHREIMEDVIQMGFDGKHSWEDAIQPVEAAWEEYGGRIAVLGGIDVDFICTHAPEAVYTRSRAMVEKTRARGGFALGTGNSVPEYVPDEGYFAMTRAALEDES